MMLWGGDIQIRPFLKTARGHCSDAGVWGVARLKSGIHFLQKFRKFEPDWKEPKTGP